MSYKLLTNTTNKGATMSFHIPNKREARQLEDGSYQCLTCRNDWYACDCPLECSKPRDKENVMATQVFNEETLRKDIHKQWGEFGAHADVIDMLIKKATNNHNSKDTPND